MPAPPEDRRRDRVVWLVAILALAAMLRVWGLRFGLPHTLARPDEDATVAIALKFFRRSFNPGFFDWPSLFMYITTLAFVVYFQVGRVIGWFPTENTFVVEATVNQSPLRVITRGLSATAGVLTVATIHAIGRRLFDGTTALVGALFLAGAPLHVRDSHFGVTDVTATFFVTLSFLFTVKFAQEGKPRDWIVSALLAGAAASTKYNAGLVVLPGVFATLLGSAGQSWMKRIGLVPVYIALAIAAFFVGTPYALIDRPAFLAALASITAHLRGGHAAMAGPGWIVHLSSSLRYGVGLPILVAGGIGFLLAVWRNWRHGVLLLTFPLAYYAFIGAGETAFARYIIPVVPFLCLAAGYAVVEIGRLVARVMRRPRLAPAAAWIIAAVAAAPSVSTAVRSDFLLARVDSRLIAADWIRERYKDGISIAQTGTVAGQVQMTTAAPDDAAARYPALKFEPESGRFFTVPADQEGQPQMIVVERCPLTYCDVPPQWMKVLRERFELEHEIVAYDASSPALVYDRDDDFYLPLSGLSAVTRPGPNITIFRRRMP